MAANWMEERMVCAVEALVEEQRTANEIAFLTYLRDEDLPETIQALEDKLLDRLTPTTPNQEQNR